MFPGEQKCLRCLITHKNVSVFLDKIPILYIWYIDRMEGSTIWLRFFNLLYENIRWIPFSHHRFTHWIGNMFPTCIKGNYFLFVSLTLRWFSTRKEFIFSERVLFLTIQVTKVIAFLWSNLTMFCTTFCQHSDTGLDIRTTCCRLRDCYAGLLNQELFGLKLLVYMFSKRNYWKPMDISVHGFSM